MRFVLSPSIYVYWTLTSVRFGCDGISPVRHHEVHCGNFPVVELNYWAGDWPGKLYDLLLSIRFYCNYYLGPLVLTAR